MGFAQKVENGHCRSGGLSLRLRAFALALRGPPAISQIAVLPAVIDRRYSAEPDIMALFVQSHMDRVLHSLEVLKVHSTGEWF